MKFQNFNRTSMVSLMILLILILTIGYVTSCKKYLDKKSSNAIVSPSTIDDLQGLLDDASTMNLSRTPTQGEASADDYFLLPSTYNSLDTRSQQVYIWQPNDYYYQDDWARAYNPVYNANYCLEWITKISRTSQNAAKWDNVKGSALFFRSYYFLMLVWNFSKAFDSTTADKDLGIAIRLSSDFNLASVRASVKQTYDRIIEDAKESILFLPDIPLHTYRPSKSASYGLLARAYLSMRNYDSALKYSSLCLQIKNQLIDFNGDNDFLGTVSTYPLKQFNKETIFYSELYTGDTYFLILLPSTPKIDTVLFSSYDSLDIRKKAYFNANSGYFNFKGSYSQGATYFSGIATDEIYLIRAECNARVGNKGAGDKNAALADLNLLLSKRYTNANFVPDTASSPTEALKIVLAERRKELLFRGLRWIDIKRLNKEDYNITPKRLVNGQVYSLLPNANYYALPLPTDIINLTGMPQNSP